MKINFPKSRKARLREIQEALLEQMVIEQDFQGKLRLTMVTSNDPEEVAKAKKLFDESVRHWEVLNRALWEYKNQASSKVKIDPNTILIVGGGIAEIAMILYFETFVDIIRTKALPFVLKGRV